MMRGTDAVGGQWRATADRRSWIGERVLAHGSVSIDEVVAEFGVSRMTVHRDLDELERRGVLRKVRGGASAQPSTRFESDVRYRLQQRGAEKEALSAAAARLVRPGDAVLLDESTTVLPLARMLPGIGSVTVLSNFRLLLNELADADDVRLVGLGGDYDPRFATYTGPLCREMVSALRPDLYITSTTAVDGLTAFHPDPQIADVKRAMLAAVARSALLLDHTKLGHRALHRVAAIGDFDEIYVDEAAPAAVVRELREAGTEVTVVPVPSPGRSADTKGIS